MSWAALNRELRELLPRFSLPADWDAVHELADHLNAAEGPDAALFALQASWLEPSPAEAEALQQCVL